MAGHSFGGYIAGNYSLKYSKYIKKLLLFSPIGLKIAPEDEDWKEKARNYKGPGPPRWVLPIVSCAWESRYSPFGTGRFLGQR